MAISKYLSPQKEIQQPVQMAEYHSSIHAGAVEQENQLVCMAYRPIDTPISYCNAPASITLVHGNGRIH